LVRSVVLAPDGAVLVAGAFRSVNGLAAEHLARLRSDGTFPVLESARLQEDGVMSFALRGNTGEVCRLERSSDLRSWATVWTGPLADGQLPWREAIEVGATPRFFRAVRVERAR